MKREFSAGGVVFRKPSKLGTQFSIEWLVAKSSPNKVFPNDYWSLPKGWLDDIQQGREPGPLASGKKKAIEEEIRSAAIREVKEEGGVGVKIIKKLGSEKYFFTFEGERILKFVTFYLMEWTNDLPEGPGFETETVEWLSYDKARKKLSNSLEKKVLDKAKVELDSGLQQKLV